MTSDSRRRYLFAAYMSEIDRLCLAQFGVRADDLPSYDYRDAFDHDVVPAEVVAKLTERAVRMEGYPGP